jgi:hypothetical protein
MTSPSDEYDSEYPSESKIPQSLKDFIKHYYKIVDSHDHSAYSKCFTENGFLVAHGNTIQGREGRCHELLSHLRHSDS